MSNERRRSERSNASSSGTYSNRRSPWKTSTIGLDTNPTTSTNTNRNSNHRVYNPYSENGRGSVRLSALASSQQRQSRQLHQQQQVRQQQLIQQKRRQQQLEYQYQPKRKRKSIGPSVGTILLGYLGSIIVGIVMIACYVKPLLDASYQHKMAEIMASMQDQHNEDTAPFQSEEAVLNERHLMINPDIQGTTPWYSVFVHDYWGNPLLPSIDNDTAETRTQQQHQHVGRYHKSASRTTTTTTPAKTLLASDVLHRSWRPFSVLSIRLLHNIPYVTDDETAALSALFIHRIVNVYLHVTCGMMLGVLTSQLFPTERFWVMKLTEYMTMSIFCLHPAHVEATANVANRPHLLALLFSIGIILWLASTGNVLFERSIDHLPLETRRRLRLERKKQWTSVPPGAVLLWIAGLLSCETIVFQLPAIIMTTVIVRWRQGRATPFQVVQSLYPIMRVLGALTVAYLLLRYWLLGAVHKIVPDDNGTVPVDHPTGLFEWVEAPFAHFTGLHRLRNYAYVTVVHIGKAIGVDPIGFAHEFSKGCLEPIEMWWDVRAGIVLLVLFGIFASTVDLTDRESFVPGMLWAMAMSWFAATVVPVCGILQVPTFVADRLTLPATVPVALFVGEWCSHALYFAKTATIRLVVGTTIGSFLFLFWGRRVFMRAHHWTDHRKLLLHTKSTCPRSAKNLLHLSEFHSNWDFQDQYDLRTALKLAREAESVDPDYCPVSYQLARLLYAASNNHSLEPYLAKAILCQETSLIASEFWYEYWAVKMEVDARAPSRKDDYIEYLGKQGIELD